MYPRWSTVKKYVVKIFSYYSKNFDILESIPEIMKNECNNCTEESKALGIKVFTFLLKKEPEVWKQLEKKYDPDGEFRKKHKKEIDEYLAKFS